MPESLSSDTINTLTVLLFNLRGYKKLTNSHYAPHTPACSGDMVVRDAGRILILLLALSTTPT